VSKKNRQPIELRAVDVAGYWMAKITRLTADAAGVTSVDKLTKMRDKSRRILRHMHRIREVQLRAKMKRGRGNGEQK
jgi:hypothetical protein